MVPDDDEMAEDAEAGGEMSWDDDADDDIMAEDAESGAEIEHEDDDVDADSGIEGEPKLF